MQLNRDKKFVYPWRNHNAFRLFVDGENYFPHIFGLIDKAQNFVLIEQYLVESGEITTRLIDHLVHAAQRGVEIYLLIDDYGSLGLNKNDRERLKEENVQLVLYNPLRFRNWYKNLRRDHRKIICIDANVGFTGGAGFTDEFITTNRPLGWHDIMLQISGPVLGDWLTSFTGIWSQSTSSPIRLIKDVPIKETGKNMKGRLVTAHTPRHQEISRSLIRQIKQSKDMVWLATPYFIATRKLRREIKRAAQRGVDVRLLLPTTLSDHPWVTHAFRNYYTRLLQNGVRIFEYQPRFLHAKVIVCDQWISLGSSNLDRWNRRWSMDANQEIENDAFAREVKQFFKNDFFQSKEILLADWKKRGWLQRLKEKSCQKIVFLLDILGNSYRE